jgi:hypothetical protein
MMESIKVFFTGLAKKDAADRLEGRRKQNIGKDAMPFEAFRLLCRRLMKKGGKRAVFAHAFLTLSWSLMCRVNNTASLRAHHFEWSGDCGSVLFSRTKTDRTGSARDGVKHVFSNPQDPMIDVVLSLANFLSTHAPAASEGEDDTYFSPPLFHGGDQQKRFVEIMQSLMEEEDIRDALGQMGVDIAEIAGHSIRKGATSFAASGTTMGANFAALCRRGGWSLGVQERYVPFHEHMFSLQQQPHARHARTHARTARTARPRALPAHIGACTHDGHRRTPTTRYVFLLAALDKVIGRIVAGLPPEEFKFAELPAHFPPDAEGVAAAVREQFGAWADAVGIRELLPFCLAALVQHEEWLKENLTAEGPDMHPIFSSPFFASASDFADIKTKVIRSGTSSPHLRASGVPPLTAVLGKLQGIEAHIQADEEYVVPTARNMRRASLAHSLVTLLFRSTLIAPWHAHDDDLLTAF